MQIFFKSRDASRQFAAKSENLKAVDNGTKANKRWGVVLKQKAQ